MVVPHWSIKVEWRSFLLPLLFLVLRERLDPNADQHFLIIVIKKRTSHLIRSSHHHSLGYILHRARSAAECTPSCREVLFYKAFVRFLCRRGRLIQQGAFNCNPISVFLPTCFWPIQQVIPIIDSVMNPGLIFPNPTRPSLPSGSGHLQPSTHLHPKPPINSQ